MNVRENGQAIELLRQTMRLLESSLTDIWWDGQSNLRSCFTPGNGRIVGCFCRPVSFRHFFMSKEQTEEKLDLMDEYNNLRRYYNVFRNSKYFFINVEIENQRKSEVRKYFLAIKRDVQITGRESN